MKFAGIALSVVVVVVGLLPAGTRAFPLTPYAPRVVIPILKDDRSQDAYGGYSFSYGTGNGIYRDEVGRQNYGQVTQGGWSYTSPRASRSRSPSWPTRGVPALRQRAPRGPRPPLLQDASLLKKGEVDLRPGVGEWGATGSTLPEGWYPLVGREGDLDRDALGEV
nr:uncharacterized protein LOC113827697 [Penaeus vannamei]